MEIQKRNVEGTTEKTASSTRTDTTFLCFETPQPSSALAFEKVRLDEIARVTYRQLRGIGKHGYQRPKPSIFISYSHKDEPDPALHPTADRWLTFVVSHLGPAQAHGHLELWDDVLIGKAAETGGSRSTTPSHAPCVSFWYPALANLTLHPRCRDELVNIVVIMQGCSTSIQQ